MDVQYKAQRYSTPTSILMDAIHDKMNVPQSEKVGVELNEKKIAFITTLRMR